MTSDVVSDAMPGSPGWEPILDGALADEARASIDDVARALAERVPLYGCETDVAVFWAYLAGALDHDWVAASYERACSALCDTLSAHRSLALHGGLAGAGWALAHISDDGSADQLLADVDDALLHALAVERWTLDYDLIGGLVGYGVYFVERLISSEAPTALHGLRRVVDHLLAISEDTGEGIAWYTDPALLPTWQRETFPDGYFNCGLAHGVPGVIALLGRVAALECEQRAHRLCLDAMRWMRAQMLRDDAKGRYPEARRREERSDRPARTAWCYGDPGVAIAGWSAAARLGRSTDDWCELALIAATRDPTLCGVLDPCLCHPPHPAPSMRWAP